MIFCVDIGNSGVKCGVLNASATLSRERIGLGADPAELSRGIRRAAGVALDFRGAVISSVVPELTRAVAVDIFESVGIAPLEVSDRLRLPLDLAVPVPSRVGTDRICAAAGATDDERRDAVVIDTGSAITVDLVRDGRFLGGVILPGPRAALLALAEHTARLPRIDYTGVTERFPANIDATETAMVLGASLGAVGGILEAVRWLEGIDGPVDRHFLTGGEAPALAPRLPASWIHEPDLTLRGLYRIAALNLPQ